MISGEGQPSSFWPNRSAAGAAWAAQTTFCSSSDRSPVKPPPPAGSIQTRPSAISMWENISVVGNWSCCLFLRQQFELQSAAMLNFDNDYSRRAFLGATLAGAGSLLLGEGHLVPTGTASMLNLAANTAPDDVTSLSIHEVAPLVKQKKMLPRGNPWAIGWANAAVVRGSGGTYNRWIQRSVAAPPSRSDTAAALPP